MKVVIDTNVFISGIFWKGAPNEIITLAEEGRIKIFATPKTVSELSHVLKRERFTRYIREGETTIAEIISYVLQLVSLVSPHGEVTVITDDPDDNMFLACAIVAQAVFIISGDKHLLNLKQFQGIPIVSARQFLKKFEG